MSERKRILLVDDHDLVRSGLSELIRAEPDLEVCGATDEAPEAVTLVEKTRPHVVVIDITLKKGSGVELIKQIKAIDASIRMLVCSMHDETLYGERVLSAGAMGYVSKQEPAKKVIEAIRRILDGRIYASEQLTDRVLRRLGQGAEEAARSPVESLSDREIEVLGLLGQGLSTREIAERLQLSTKTIDTYRENLKTKLNLKNVNELLRYAVAWTFDPESGRNKG